MGRRTGRRGVELEDAADVLDPAEPEGLDSEAEARERVAKSERARLRGTCARIPDSL